MSRKAGLWLIGAHGGVSTTVALGLIALQTKRTMPMGLVSELSIFEHLDLLDWPEIVIGGHEIRQTSFVSEAEKLASVSRALDGNLVAECENKLREFDSNVRPGIVWNVGDAIQELADESNVQRAQSARQAVDLIKDDLNFFVTQNELDTCIVVNLASTEPNVSLTSSRKRGANSTSP